VERLLPIYCKAITDVQSKDNSQWYLQEDGDPSHGIRKAGLAQAYKASHNVVNLVHPPQSPDLNPIEGIWNIVKQRLCRRIFDSKEQMKEALQEEWDKIILKEIQELTSFVRNMALNRRKLLRQRCS
jgi:transposase